MAKDLQAPVPVNIHLTTSIEHEGEREMFELMLSGEFQEKNGSYFLKYTEVQEEGTIQTVVKFSDKGAVILRSGAVKMRLPFNEKEPMNGSYTSPHGTLAMLTKTNKLSHSHTYSESQLEGTLQLDYHLLMQGTAVGAYTMELKFESV
ncbi:hypothetical protein AC623_18635 [Bacillus sp. FJAT-27231]|uniref:DUF1934 domain-containing protein n=1 Tax=Bacillus sp. FJAT-27231 TaxID=1679168 RepID=UPI0006712843|nr:DUF1934 domain-containing protein [Bacillus sp. FJAT-27231]KMY55702.1 hypothetical protein AC623_18635 [Bacillus sp. FJAT-27231]